MLLRGDGVLDWLELPDFLDAATLADVRRELRLAAGAAAGLIGREPGDAYVAAIRRATRLTPNDDVRRRVLEGLDARRAEIERWYGAALGICEEPQFLRYEAGDYFVAHQDGNTPLVRDHSRLRRISVVVFLSAPSPAPDGYGGGEFVLHGGRDEPDRRVALTPPPGALVAFRAETTHEVLPVAHGERYTIAAWFLARER